MKSELSALAMPASSANQADQPLLNRQPGQDLPATRNEVDCVTNTNNTFPDPGTFKDSYRGGTIRLRDSAGSNQRSCHTAPTVITRKKRFG